MQQNLGVDATPNYVGTAYFTIQSLDVTDWGNRVPQFTALVRQHTGATPQYTVNRLLSRSKLDSSYWDTSALATSTDILLGYPISGPHKINQLLDPVVTTFDLLTAENNGVLSFFKRDTPTTIPVIDSDDLASHESGDSSVLRKVKVSDQASYALPSQVEVLFVDPTRNFQQSGMRETKRFGGGGATTSINLPLTITALQARKLGRRILWGAWAERQAVEFHLPPKYLWLQEGDLVTLPTANRTLNVRITSIDIGYNWLMKVNGITEQEQVLNPPAVADDGNVTIPPPYNPDALILVLMDIPPLRDDLIDQIGLFWCCCPATFGGTFKHADLYQSTDNGNSYNYKATTNVAGIIGTTDGALGPPPGSFGLRDDVNEVTVTMFNGDLNSATTQEVQGGANWCLIGLEILAFETATVVGVNQYMLQNLWRGLRDTTDVNKTSTHAINDQFILLSGGTGIHFMPLLRKGIGNSRIYKCVPAKGKLTDSDPETFVSMAECTVPFRPAPVTLGTLPATYSSSDGVEPTLVNTTPISTDIPIRWQRRSVEQDYTFGNGVGEPNDFSPELYGLTIFELVSGVQGPQLGEVRAVSAKQFYYYTTDQQTADGHTPGAPIWVEVYQQGNISVGNVASAAIGVDMEDSGSGGGSGTPATGTPSSPTVMDFSTVTSITSTSTYGSASTNTPVVSVSWGTNVTLFTSSWSTSMGKAVYASGGVGEITFTPAAGHSVTISSFVAGDYGSASYPYQFTTLRIIDSSGTVVWQPSPLPTIGSGATTISPSYTGNSGVALTLQFEDEVSGGVAINAITFTQTPA